MCWYSTVEKRAKRLTDTTVETTDAICQCSTFYFVNDNGKWQWRHVELVAMASWSETKKGHNANPSTTKLRELWEIKQNWDFFWTQNLS